MTHTQKLSWFERIEIAKIDEHGAPTEAEIKVDPPDHHPAGSRGEAGQAGSYRRRHRSASFSAVVAGTINTTVAVEGFPDDALWSE